MKINGFLIFYLASMSFSSICVIILNRIFMIDYSEENKISWKFILMFSIPMILALIFYKVYSIAFSDENNEENKEIKIIKFGGYVIYQEKKLSDEKCCISCCSDCIESFNWIMDVVANYVDFLIYSKVCFVVNAHALIM